MTCYYYKVKLYADYQESPIYCREIDYDYYRKIGVVDRCLGKFVVDVLPKRRGLGCHYSFFLKEIFYGQVY